jgi:hypothetical protein
MPEDQTPSRANYAVTISGVPPEDLRNISAHQKAPAATTPRDIQAIMILNVMILNISWAR